MSTLILMGSLNYIDGRPFPRLEHSMMADHHRASNLIESFGCHLSWCELRSIAADKQTLSREEAILARENWDYNDRPTYYTALRNLQGFIAYHLNKSEEALDFFEDVIEKDASNINALGNVAFLHDTLCKTEEKKQYIQRLTRVLESQSYEERARAYADKAHAIRYFEQFKRCFRYMKYIERAAAIGRKCDGPTRAEWFFDYALALYRRDVQMIYLRKLKKHATVQSNLKAKDSECFSDKRIEEGFLKACGLFLEVARTSTSNDYKALSWVFLGILINHDPENRSLTFAFPNQPDLHHLTAIECFEKGLEINSESNSVVLRRVGSEYVKLGRFQCAKKLLDEALTKERSRYVYRYRADMFLAMYESANVEVQRTQGREWLLKAVKEFTEAIKLKEVHADYSDLGYVYLLLGEFDKALVRFEQATRSEQDDYFDPVLTHQRWALCLERKNQHEGSQMQLKEAHEVCKKILETPLEEDQPDYFSEDFDHYNTTEKPGFVRILLDYDFWTAHSKRRLSELNTPDDTVPSTNPYVYDLFVWHAERDSRWTVAFVRKLEWEHGLRCCIQRRDFEVGMEITANIMRCLQESYKSVIILSPLSHKESYWSFVSNRAIREAELRRSDGDEEYILPIKLRDCQEPPLLQTVTALECEEGQMLRLHWDQLVQKVTQG